MKCPLILALITCCWSLTSPPRVSTPYGSIRGYYYTADYGGDVAAFKHIPFARPPTGDLRWRKPVKPDKWSVELDGTNFGPACAETVLDQNPPGGYSEDCLHVNVYTSEKCMKSGCAVVFYLHGGSLVYYSATLFGDEHIANSFVRNDVIAVTTNYRLGIFGAMALGDENALPANLVMHDCIAALKFTREIIASFGGDVDRITIFGHSTGGYLINLLAFSPGITPAEEPPLFSSVVVMSGLFTLQDEPSQICKSRAHAAAAGCTGSNTEIMTCLRGKTTAELCAAQLAAAGTHAVTDSQLGRIAMMGELFPMSRRQELFEHPAKFRFMTGSTSKEADKNDIRNVDFVGLMGFENKEECFAKFEADEKSGAFDSGGHAFTSMEIWTSTWEAASAVAASGNEVFVYQYDHPGHPYHADDMSYLMNIHEFERDPAEEWLSRVYPVYFANFMNGHRPAPDWEPFNTVNSNYYSINKSIGGPESPHMENKYQSNMVNYWKKEMVAFDANLTAAKRKQANIPAAYHSLSVGIRSAEIVIPQRNNLELIHFLCIIFGASVIFMLGFCFGRSKSQVRPVAEKQPLLIMQRRGYHELI